MSRIMDALPHLLTIGLGTALLVVCYGYWGLLYIPFVVLTTVWFLWRICTNCYGYGNKACPSGYGMLSSYFFGRAKRPDFRKAFRYNIASIVAQWILPTVGGVVCLILGFGFLKILFFALFLLTGYVLLPFLSRRKGCKGCPQSGDCPWSR